MNPEIFEFEKTLKFLSKEIFREKIFKLEDIFFFWPAIDELQKPLSKEEIVGSLLVLQNNGKIFRSDSYYSFDFSDTNLDEAIKQKELRVSRNRKIYSFLNKRFLKFIKLLPFINLVLVDFADGNSNLICCIYPNYLNFKGAISFCTNCIVRLLNLKNKYPIKIHVVVSLQSPTIKERTAKSAYWYLNLKPLLNKDKEYEKLMNKISWVFDIYQNYPLDKVSWGYRVG